ncbi:MAG: hypothetical protein ACKO72_09215 [Actinomycetes bacterium]
MPRGGVVDVAWPSRLVGRCVAVTLVASMLVGSVAGVCAILGRA